MAEKEYTKLTPLRRKAGFAAFSVSRSNLWLGKDHLLSVEVEGYTERYKRFYFRDLQAVIVRRTNRAMIIGLIVGAIAALCGVFALVSRPIEAKWILGITAAIFALPFLINLAYGPTCACQLRTAVQIEDVPSLSRVRRARKLIRRLRPLIAAAQGEITAEEIPGRFQAMLAPAASGHPIPAESPRPAETTEASPPLGG